MTKARSGYARPLVLGIETSCDDTAAAVVSADRKILANRVYNQFREHEAYGGVVPEIAARSHVDHLDRLLEGALAAAGVRLGEIDAVAATAGPGLIGGVMVGLVSAKALSLAAGKPFLALNHLESHALSPRLLQEFPFPYLVLLISGGHCQLLSVEGLGRYRRLGTTIDDAAGEAFDKGAKLLGLPQPGGPAIEQAAMKGSPAAFALPRPMVGREGCDFSFSGLKTALLHKAREATGKGGKLPATTVADLAASYQAAIADSLTDRTRNAMRAFRRRHQRKTAPVLVTAGGVAANELIRSRMEKLSDAEGFAFFAPPPWLCTDNAAMVAWAGIEHLEAGHTSPLDFPARARWPLDKTSAARVGHGRKGAKV